MSPVLARVLTGAATAVALGAVAVGFMGGTPTTASAGLGASVAVAAGWVVLRRQPGNPVGPALAWSSACVALVLSNDVLAASAYTRHPLPLAGIAKQWWVGCWPVNLAGVLALLLLFPDGRLGGRLWRALPWTYAAATLGMIVSEWGGRQVDGQIAGVWSGPREVIGTVSMSLVGACLILAVASQVVRYRHGDQRRREQIRWLLLAGAAVVTLLIAGWVLQSLGVVIGFAYAPFLSGIVVLLPAAVGVAVLRHDLFDVDRLLGEGTAWVITLVVSAGIYSLVVATLGYAVAAGTGLGNAAAVFLTALPLLPLQRHVAGWVGRFVDRDRHVAVAEVERFAADVRTGRRQPEEIEEVLRLAQRDPLLRIQVVRPDGSWGLLDGRAVVAPTGIPLEAGGDEIARIRLGWDSARARRRITALAKAAWVPIEVSRLRLVLREALDEVEASSHRLAEAAAAERQRLERELHDGAQQRIVATGMRLRSLQRHLPPGQAAEVDTAVAELEETVAELRRIANGVRPVRLSDGLGAALAAVRDASPVPLSLVVDEPDHLDEATRLTAYLVVSEAVTNALKHAFARRIDVSIAPHGASVAITVVDDGVGGVPAVGLTALRDRIHSVGGTLKVWSPVGGGTRIEALL
ncbi:histidine kinase [Streptomyces sp. NPDC056352]|uniref:sensor histidine kinase n=1 Tax=Streptomyces sp. NPDC056352 TaxID=3345791 RepID=UPI0035DE22C6